MENKITLMSSDFLSQYRNEETKPWIDVTLTDFALLTGAIRKPEIMCYTEKTNYYFLFDQSERKLLNKEASDHIAAVIRPVIKISDPNRFTESSLLVTLGEYPQQLVSLEDTYQLEALFRNKKLPFTGISNTFYQATLNQTSYSISHPYNFKLCRYPVFQLGGERYMRYLIQEAAVPRSARLRNYRFLPGDFAWFKVSPVEWWVDHNYNQLISRYGLVAGIPHEYLFNYLDCGLSKDLFFFEAIAEERLKNDSKCHPSVEKYLTLIEEKTRLLRSNFPESSSYFSDILDCAQKIREELPKEYQKRK